MHSYSGRLKELGQATINHRTRHSFSNYSYLQVGDTMVKNIACWHGLDGKLQQQLGEEITLHTNNGFVVAFKAPDGNTYCGEKTYRSESWLYIIFGFFGTTFSLLGLGGLFGLILSIACVYVLFRFYKRNRTDEGADLPNVIRIPKA